MKGFLNPGAHVSWTKSRWKKIQGVYDHFFFLIKLDPLGQVVLKKKMTCLDEDWAHPLFLLKGAGDERTKTKFRERVAQQDGYGLSAVKTHASEYREAVMAALEAVKPRMNHGVWDRLMILYDNVFNKTPVPFHWANGGVFRTRKRRATRLTKNPRRKKTPCPSAHPVRCFNTTSSSQNTTPVRTRDR